MSIGCYSSFSANQPSQINSFTEDLSSKKLALFLDFDGTLTSIVEHPDNVKVSLELIHLLKNLTNQCDGAVAIITGRTINNIDNLLQPLKLSIAGVHGAEWRKPNTSFISYFSEANLTSLGNELHELLQDFPKVWLEDKQYALAIHYRSVPQYGLAIQRRVAKLIINYPQLNIIVGKMVIEIKPKIVNKGYALQKFMAIHPFANRIPLAIGDDTTDEFAFAMANKLGGSSIKIGKGKTCAKQRLTDPNHLKKWFEELLSFKYLPNKETLNE